MRECGTATDRASFRTDLLKIDTATVQRIVVDPPGARTRPFLLRRVDNHGWIGQRAGTVTDLTSVAVDATLAALLHVATDSIYTAPRRRPLELHAANATRVRLQPSDERPEEVFFLLRRDSGLLFSFEGEREIYALLAPRPTALLRPFAAYRDRVLFREPPHRVRHLSLSIDDQSWVWSRDAERTWRLYGTQPAQHDALTLYLMDLNEHPPTEFADDFSETDARLRADVVLKGDFPTPVRLRYFAETPGDSTSRTVLHMTHRPNDYFYVEPPRWSRLVAPATSE